MHFRSCRRRRSPGRCGRGCSPDSGRRMFYHVSGAPGGGAGRLGRSGGAGRGRAGRGSGTRGRFSPSSRCGWPGLHPAFPADLLGARDPAAPALLRPQPAQHGEAEALHRGGGHLHRQVSAALSAPAAAPPPAPRSARSCRRLWGAPSRTPRRPGTPRLPASGSPGAFCEAGSQGFPPQLRLAMHSLRQHFCSSPVCQVPCWSLGTMTSKLEGGQPRWSHTLITVPPRVCPPSVILLVFPAPHAQGPDMAHLWALQREDSHMCAELGGAYHCGVLGPPSLK